MPSVTEEGRKRRIEEALEAQRGTERVRERWRGRDEFFDVIKVPLNVVLLNPHSHRIRAQLESHPQAELVASDPYSDDAQAILEHLLKSAPRYEELKSDLAAGQRDHGVVTVEGLLVNANRRAVALRELGEQYILVAVLPGDAGDEEIAELELALQMKKDLREEYSFTNEMLFIDDLVNNYNQNPSRVAEVLGRPVTEVERFTRMLAIVRQLQARSGHRIKTLEFDDKRQALQEIDDTYEEMRQRDPEEALRVRDARLCGLILGMGYRELREVNEDFLDEYFLPMLDEQNEMLAKPIRELTTPPPDDTTDLPGVDVLGDASSETADPSRLLDLLTSTVDETSVELPSNGGVRVSTRRGELLSELRDSMERAAEYSREDRLAIDRLAVPTDALRKARKQLKRGLEKLQRVISEAGFDIGAFEYEVRKAEAQLRAIRDEVSQHQS